ncbi:cold-shock protein [Shinella sp. S4-D37]|uniref:cold-shock protein n=1 Tax=Shinella sp. S4-D37 TaxID=3161999 RepID=UPI0034671259
MSQTVYAVGDMVKLKPDLFRRAEGNRPCRIVGVLPSDHGEIQYRVHLGNEKFERRILASDIEEQESAAARPSPAPRRSESNKEPWFKASSIRISK